MASAERGEPRMRSVVAIEGHPDDVETSCLGTLLSLREQGWHVTIVSITDGSGGATHDPAMTGDTIAKIRYHEASSVAEAVGGEFRSLGAKDGYLYDTQALRRSLAALLQEVRADLVFAPPPNDYHFDHITASELAFSAVYYAKNYFVGNVGDQDDTVAVDRLQRVPALYYYDSVAGMGFEPSFYIDISAHFEKKRDLVALHKSQMANMKSAGGWDLVEYIDIVSRFRGLQAGTQYAEAFQSCLRWPRSPALRAFPF